jgi:hypothetical protein
MSVGLWQMEGQRERTESERRKWAHGRVSVWSKGIACFCTTGWIV